METILTSMSFAQLTPAEVAEVWWSNYREALVRLGVEWPANPTTIEEMLVQAGGHRLAARAADGLTKRIVPDDAWRAYRNNVKGPQRGPGMQRQVAKPPSRKPRQSTKSKRREWKPSALARQVLNGER